MSGFLTNGLPLIGILTGKETLNSDTNGANGSQPQSVSISLAKLAVLETVLMNTLDKTMVAGDIYFSQFNIGVSETVVPDSSISTTPVATISDQSFSVTGINVAVGTPGGTDTWWAAIYNSAGVLVAQSIAAGVTAGTALTIQQIPMYQPGGVTIGPVTLPSGTYYLALQSNGSTAKFKSINSPIWPLGTGHNGGSASQFPALSGTLTTYTANVGPMLSLY